LVFKEVNDIHPCGPGCGVMLAEKFINESLGKQLLYVDSSNLTGICVPDPLSAAIATGSPCLMRAENVKSIPRFPVFLIAYNLSGQTHLAKIAGMFGWAATATISHPDDLKNKLTKAASLTGLRVLEILTPCPKEWEADPANIVELSREAVEIGLWPLYEIENKKLIISYRINKPAPPDRFLSLQRKIPYDRASAEKRWRTILEGKIYEI
jgi:hypothetical protein